MSKPDPKRDKRDIPHCPIAQFEKVFNIHYNSFFTYAYGFVMDEMEADDIVQGAFLRVWEIRDRLRTDSDLTAYLFIAVKHGCMRYFRRLKVTDRFQKRQAEALVLSFGEEMDTEIHDQTRERVREALAKLSPQQARIIEMHVIKGMKYQQIAQELGISENTVKTHLKRSYRILRDTLSVTIAGVALFSGPF